MRWVPVLSVASIVAAALVRLLGGCSIDGLDIAGKACPCVTGFRCDEPRHVCVAEGLDGAIVDVGDAMGQPDAPLGAFVIQRFAPTWQTSRSIRWDWEVSGNADEFAEYQIIVGSSEDAVRRQSSTADVFDRRLNPELGSFGGRDPVSAGGGGPARGWSVTDKHDVAKDVFAKLVVRDKAGRQNVSEVVSTKTIDDTKTLVLFADSLVAGAVTTPTALKRVTVDCYGSSTGCLQLAKVDCGDAGACAIEIGVTGFDDRVINGMTAEQFKTAFVELAVRGGSGAAADPYSDLILTIGAPACLINGSPCRFRASRSWSFRPGLKEFRLVQLPLQALQLETPTGPGPALTYEYLQANGFQIEALTIHGSWTDGANIGIDEGNIRW